MVVVPADQVETPVKSGELFIPAQDGVFMSDARYQRYRRAIADQIQRLQLQQK